MLNKTKIALTALLVAGISSGAMVDLASAKSNKSHGRTYRTAPVYLQDRTPQYQQYRNDWAPNPYQNWEGWAPPPAHAGGVG